MQNFIEYPYNIQLNELAKTAEEAIKAGYNVTVIINGEYYNISTDEEKTENTTA